MLEGGRGGAIGGAGTWSSSHEVGSAAVGKNL